MASQPQNLYDNMPAKKKAAAKKTTPPPADAAPAPARKAAVKKKASKAATGKSPRDSGIFEGQALALAAASFAEDKKASNVIVLDVRGISPITDYFVICDGASMPQLRAIRNEVADRMKDEHGIKAYASHGTSDSGWMILDFGDVIVHIFHTEKRDFYAFEDLWNDAERV